MKSSKQQGFTLIELIIVIVILGILAVSAAPKFLDIQGDARASTLNGLAAALKGAVQISHSKALVSGDTNAANTNVDFDGDGNNDVRLDFGYPDPSHLNTVLFILDINGVQSAGAEVNADWELDSGTDDDDFQSVRIFPSGDYINDTNGFDTDNLNCYVQYSLEQAAGAEPSITVVSDGC